MIKVLIVDDEQHCIATVAKLLRKHSNFEICGSAKSAGEAIALTKALRPDLVFLDIRLGQQSGFDYLDAFLPKIEFDVIFTTAYNVSAAKVFEYSALHYLLKPIDPEDFDAALQRMDTIGLNRGRLDQFEGLEYNMNPENKYKLIHIATLEAHYNLNTKDILFVKADSNYSEFHLMDKSKIVVSKTLKNYATLLKGSHFYLANRSYLVNVKQISHYRKKSRELTMSDNTIIAVAVRRQKDFIANNYTKSTE